MKTVLTCILCFASLAFAETKLGKPLALKQVTEIDQLASRPEAYVNKTVQVKGAMRDVCQKMGCWTVLADPASGKAVRIKVKDGEIVFPKDGIGRTVVAEGKFVKLVMTKEQAVAQAKHEAEENGRKFDPASITSGTTTYQIAGTGAVILD